MGKARVSITLTYLLSVLVKVETKRPRSSGYVLRKAVGEIVQPQQTLEVELIEVVAREHEYVV